MDKFDRFEEEAAEFYRDTGFLAPGKDEPAAACGQTDFDRQEVRRLMFKAWGKGRSLVAASEARAEALEAELVGMINDRDSWQGNCAMWKSAHDGEKAKREAAEKACERAKNWVELQAADEKIASLARELEAAQKRVKELSEGVAKAALEEHFKCMEDGNREAIISTWRDRAEQAESRLSESEKRVKELEEDRDGWKREHDLEEKERQKAESLAKEMESLAGRFQDERDSLASRLSLVEKERDALAKPCAEALELQRHRAVGLFGHWEKRPD